MKRRWRMTRSGCSVLVAVIITLAGATHARADKDSAYCEPGPATARAMALLKQGKSTEGCDTLLAEVRAGSDDPWAYRGVALCAVDSQQGPRINAAVDQALARQERRRPALVAYARGVRAYRAGVHDDAERELRVAAKLAPQLALVRNALAAAVNDGGDPAGSIPLLEQALRMCPDFEIARSNLAVAQQKMAQAGLRAGVWERIVARLETVPDRWDRIPRSIVAPTSRSPEDVMDAATDAEKQAARQLISRIALAPPAQRAAIIIETRRQRSMSEADLWVPFYEADSEQHHDIDKAGLTLEALLELAESLGRRDVLLHAAGFALGLAQFRVHPAQLVTIARRWTSLPKPPYAARGSASVHRAHGSISFHLGRNREALAAHRQARSLFQASDDQLGQGHTFKGEADILTLLGESDAALAAYRQARSLYLASDNQLDQGNTWVGEASVLFQLGKNSAALNAYRQARSLYLASDNQHGLAQTWFGEAEVLSILGKKDAALAAYRQARSFFLAFGDQLGQANSWRGEADVLLFLGKTAAAFAAYREARSLFPATGNQVGEGQTYIGEGNLLFLVGENDAALAAYREARSRFQASGQKVGVGNTWWLEGQVLFRIGKNDAALAAYREARSRFQASGQKVGVGNTWWLEGQVLFRIGKNDAALAAYREARSLFQAAGHELGLGSTWIGEADVLFRLGRLKTALLAARKGARFARNVKSVPNEFIAYIIEARCLADLHHRHQAIQRARDAISLLAQWRALGSSDLDRTAMADSSAPYDLLIPLLVRSPGAKARQVWEAVSLADDAHSPILLDLVATGTRRPDESNDQSLIEQRERLQRDAITIDDKLARTYDSAARTVLLRQRRDIDVQLGLNELAALGSLKAPLLTGSSIGARTRRALVRAVGPILLYYVATDETVAFLLRPGQKPQVRRIPLSRGHLQTEVRALRHDLANRKRETRGHDRRRALYDQLVAPFADAVAPGGPLTIIPHGPLHELAFEALLVDDDTPLFAHWHVSVAPSLSSLYFVRKRAKRAPVANSHDFLGIAGGTGLSLPAEEVAEVAATVGGATHLLVEHDGTRDAYAAHAPRARHLLIATHGWHLGQNRSGYVELTTSDGHATRLTAADIAHIPLRAELVTLAACDTARGRALFSDERLDLTRAFLIAGAGAVLATRWKIPEDPRIGLFLRDFYTALHTGGPDGKGVRKDEALSEARRLSLARGDHAQVWAAWVLVGDAR